MKEIVENLQKKYSRFEIKQNSYDNATQRPPVQIYNVLSWLNEEPTELEKLSDEQWDQIEVNEVNIGKLWDSLVMKSGEKSFDGDIDYDATLDKYNLEMTKTTDEYGFVL
jgi:hypothetical protein